MNDLAKEINEPWFALVCDLTTVCGATALDQISLDNLYPLYRKRASYIGIKPAAVAAAVVAAAAPADSLEELSGFTNFKLLGDALQINFKKRITLIFGTNGSGKSSLCESLKVLATLEQPNRPLQNVRAVVAAIPAFRYKFKSDAAQQAWTPAIGYGPRRATVKYFDTAIAIKNVKSAVEPGRVIVLTPFKLQVFDSTKTLTTKFREALVRAQKDNFDKLIQALEPIRTDFVKFKGRPLSVIDEKSIATLAAQIKIGEEFTDQKLLGDKQTAAAALEKAASGRWTEAVCAPSPDSTQNTR